MSTKQTIRIPSHAGSWYTDDPHLLNEELSNWLQLVQPPVSCIGPRAQGEQALTLPVPNARVIIAPHAGYSYSGPAAAWAYRALDVSKARRVFLLGPSHHHSFSRAALSRCTHYATPLGHLSIDRDITEQLHKTGQFDYMSRSVDEDEHSLEMHLPYIYKILTNTFGDHESLHPTLVPIMIGNTSRETEVSLGRILAPYLAEAANVFIVSSDFAHWGTRFRYTYYQPRVGKAINLAVGTKKPTDPSIHESIKAVDFECIDACESGNHDEWLACLSSNGNTVCGRHPIGVILAAKMAVDEVSRQTPTGHFKFIRYERSSLVSDIRDSSVSYASAFAVV